MILQPNSGPLDGRHYLQSSPDTVLWGWLPNAVTSPVLAVERGDVVTIDTLSHEGVLPDFDYDPVGWFGRQGVAPADVLLDAAAVAKEVPFDVGRAGPHVITGPIQVKGARPGDLLKVEVVGLRMRVPYGVISNRHGLGALPDEYPERRPDGSRPKTVSVFCPVDERGAEPDGVIAFGSGARARFPLLPFLGVMGVAPATEEPVNSVPPGYHGGNIDVKWLGVGSTLYLPVQIDGAGFYAGDPHFAQGNGEVALTALEGSLRADLRFSVIPSDELRGGARLLSEPFAETDTHWIPIGLDVDLDEAMRNAVRHAIEFLWLHLGMERHLAYAYLSAAADFEVTQVVDQVKGVHCMIRKADFS